jgi:hypothetical protein
LQPTCKFILKGRSFFFSISYLDMERCRGKRFPTREFRRTRHLIGWKKC